MKRVHTFWMSKCDRWYLFPALSITIERVHHTKWLGLEITFLKRWCAIEILLTKKEVSNG